ncbi:MAG: DinB family protein [Blastocatellia bacterium]|nr:DinB family protein [Blastocatellia bacterium]
MSYPVSLQERKEELTQAREKLVAELSAEQPEGALGAGNERWSVTEIAYHIHLVEKLVAGMIQQALASGSRQEFDEEKLQQEWEKIATVALDRTDRIQAPAPVMPATPPSLNESLQLLEESRKELFALVDSLGKDALASVGIPHITQRMGVLSGLGWVTLIGYHDLRHLDQIKELKASLA